MNKIKIDNKFEGTLTLYYKADSRDELTKGLDRLKLMPGKNSFDVSDTELVQVKPKLEFYQTNNRISFEVIGGKVEKVEVKTPVITLVTGALTADTYADSEDKDALEVFGRTLGLEIDKRQGPEKIKVFIAEAITKAE